jgi:hypothetical protein
VNSFPLQFVYNPHNISFLHSSFHFFPARRKVHPSLLYHYRATGLVLHKMAVLHQFDYVFALGIIFAFLDAWNIGANDVGMGSPLLLTRLPQRDLETDLK